MKIKLLKSIFILLILVTSCSTEKTDDNQENKTKDEIIKTSSNSEAFIEVNFLEGSIARYLVREQLANLDFPIDAIGETNQISGSILINTDGEVITNKSNIVVNVASLKSDSGRRDKYISRKSLESNTYPEALINIKKINNLPWPIPKNDSSEIEIIGDMTAHGVTQQITWKTKINFFEDNVEGLAKTNFKFEKFDMDIPRVAIVLSVDDNIRLELDFKAEIKYLE